MSKWKCSVCCKKPSDKPCVWENETERFIIQPSRCPADINEPDWHSFELEANYKPTLEKFLYDRMGDCENCQFSKRCSDEAGAGNDEDCDSFLTKIYKEKYGE